MRRSLSTFLTGVLIASTAPLAAGSVLAATSPGTATTTTATPPSAVNGLTIRAVTAARDGGMYFAYQNASGDNYTMVKQKADKSYDQTFGTNGTITIPGIALSNQNRRVVILSDLNDKWWVLSTSSSNTGDLAVVSHGSPTGVSVQKTLTKPELATQCLAGSPTSTATDWFISVNFLYAKRSNGAWLALNCTGAIGNQGVAPFNAVTLLALKNDVMIDPAFTPISLVSPHGSTAECHTASLVSDPTGSPSSPELWVLRLQHTNKDNGGFCDNNQNLTAPKVTGYDTLRINSAGAISRTDFASAGDSTDSRFSMRLDPGGRPLLVGTALSDNTKLIVARIKTDGTLDTSAGTNGFTTISLGSSPAGAISVSASVNGIITSPNTVYISVLLMDQSQSTNMITCSDSTSVTFGYRAMVLSYSNGLATTFGTNGIGDRVTQTVPISTLCSFRFGGSSVSTTGSPRMAYGVGANLFLVEWARPSDATGGSDGGTGTGGFTNDTGGAPSRGEGGSVGRTDTKVYSRRLPTNTQVDTTLNVLTKKASRTEMLLTRTPKVCVALTQSVVLVETGTCRVEVVDRASRNVVRSLSTRVREAEATVGTTVNGQDAVRFSAVSTRLSASARAQIAELATTAADAKRVILIGHTALLTENTVSNNRIALQRAARVKAELQKQFKAAGVKVPISIVSVGSQAPITTKKTESRQSTNRRVEVYLVP